VARQIQVEIVHQLTDLIEPLLTLCREAGEVICGHYHAPGTTDFEHKDDASPLTLADTESHAVLQAGLAAIDPTIPMLSEESAPAEVVGRRSWQRYWLVDPLDGTKEFLAETGEFTINIALIEAHKPVLGLLYLPLEQRAYVGIPGVGAYCCAPAQGAAWSRQDTAIRPLETGRELTVLASRRHRNAQLDACLTWLEANWGPIRRVNSGSALKFVDLARGAGDFYPRFSPCSEWDTAAGQALLEAAGGGLLGLDGKPLRYNCSDSLLSPHFYAIADAAHPLWSRLLRELSA
jgi:3'(2'), 5'-bisphosphate nucleotidase